jgi:hypothetical protein
MRDYGVHATFKLRADAILLAFQIYEFHGVSDILILGCAKRELAERWGRAEERSGPSSEAMKPWLSVDLLSDPDQFASLQAVNGPGIRAHDFLLAGKRQVKLFTKFAHPANLSTRHADH